MDRAEAILLLAEKALEDLRSALARIETLEGLPKPPAAFLIDRSGSLVATFADGSTSVLGKVCGNDGAPGAPGESGIGFDEIEEEYEDDGRYLIRRFVRNGEVLKSFRHKTVTPIFRGPWTEKQWDRGDMVFFGGTTFCAVRDTKAKPDTNDDWQMASRRGRDGRNGSDGKPGERGLKGDKGDIGPRGLPA